MSYFIATVLESQGGKRLVQRCDINAGTRINTLFRIKCKPSVSPTLSQELRVAVTERRQATYFGKLCTSLKGHSELTKTSLLRTIFI